VRNKNEKKFLKYQDRTGMRKALAGRANMPASARTSAPELSEEQRKRKLELQRNSRHSG